MMLLMSGCVENRRRNRRRTFKWILPKADIWVYPTLPRRRRIEGWKSEEEGIGSRGHIIWFLMINSAVEDLSDYKSSKAYSYSYFESAWLGNITTCIEIW